MKLNVGCGADIWGDIRVDVLRDSFMAMGKSTANLLADARYLPFKDKCFDELRMHEVLEHIPDWKKALHECCRVAKKMSITVPVDSYMPRHYVNWVLNLITTTQPKRLLRFFDPAYLKYVLKLRARTKEHLWQFDINTLTSLIRKAGFQKISVNILHYPLFGFQGRYFGFFKTSIKKKGRWEIIAS